MKDSSSHVKSTIGKFFHSLQGKDPLVDVFAEAPIKITQKSICSGGH